MISLATIAWIWAIGAILLCALIALIFADSWRVYGWTDGDGTMLTACIWAGVSWPSVLFGCALVAGVFFGGRRARRLWLG